MAFGSVTRKSDSALLSLSRTNALENRIVQTSHLHRIRSLVTFRHYCERLRIGAVAQLENSVAAAAGARGKASLTLWLQPRIAPV